MTQRDYEEEMITFLNNDYDLSRTEAKDSFEFLIIDRIYNSIKKQSCIKCKDRHACHMFQVLSEQESHFLKCSAFKE